MGTSAYGGQGSKGRAGSGDRPMGAATCRPKHTHGVMPTPAPLSCAQHCRRRRGRDAKGQEQHLLSRGAAVPPSPTDNAFPQWLGASDVNTLFLKTQTNAYSRKYHTAQRLSLYGTPSKGQRGNRPTLTSQTHVSPPSGDKHCRQIPLEIPNPCAHPEIPTGTLSQPLCPPPPLVPLFQYIPLPADLAMPMAMYPPPNTDTRSAPCPSLCLGPFSGDSRCAVAPVPPHGPTRLTSFCLFAGAQVPEASRS